MFSIESLMQRDYKTKKIIIIVVLSFVSAILLFGGGWLLGRNQRFSGDIGNDSLKQSEQLAERTKFLEHQLAKRIEECERLEQQLGNVEAGIDECLGTTRELRQTVSNITITSGNTGSYISELRNRITDYENRIDELNKQLQAVKASASIE